MSDHDVAGDPGIDHDELQIALRIPARRRAPRPVPGIFGPRTGDHDSDLGYDQAHDG